MDPTVGRVAADGAIGHGNSQRNAEAAEVSNNAAAELPLTVVLRIVALTTTSAGCRFKYH